jgi:hypothetical protein
MKAKMVHFLFRTVQVYKGTSISKGKVCYTEMHIIYTDPNKMLLFHVVTVLCNAHFTSFNKLLYPSRKKSLCLVSKPEMHRLLHLVIAVKSSSSQCFLNPSARLLNTTVVRTPAVVFFHCPFKCCTKLYYNS